jgi:Zn-finger nucleic acid-binding protein
VDIDELIDAATRLPNSVQARLLKQLLAAYEARRESEMWARLTQVEVPPLPPDLRCPTCDVLLAGRDDEAMPAGTCGECFGRYVSEADARLLAEHTGRAFVRPGDLGSGDSDFLCPECTGPFAPVISGGVEIDVCTRCGGRWYDVGEEEVAT